MKDRSYYLALPYSRRVELIEAEGGAYFLARMPELPGVIADGATPEEARFHLHQAFEDYVGAMLMWDEDIPEPDPWPSGYASDAGTHGPGEMDILLVENPNSETFYSSPFPKRLREWSSSSKLTGTAVA